MPVIDQHKYLGVAQTCQGTLETEPTFYNETDRAVWRAKREIDTFLAEIVEVCKRHKLSLAHEDTHGGFEVHLFKEKNIEWLKEASDSRHE